MRGGQNKYEPTEADRNTVRSMSATGFPHERIAACIGTKGIDKKTLYKHFREELDTAMDKANAAVGNKCFQAAMAGEAWAVCFWLKCRAGWKETQRFEHAGSDGGPLDSHESPAELLLSKISELSARSGQSDTQHVNREAKS